MPCIRPGQGGRLIRSLMGDMHFRVGSVTHAPPPWTSLTVRAARRVWLASKGLEILDKRSLPYRQGVGPSRLLPRSAAGAGWTRDHGCCPQALERGIVSLSIACGKATRPSLAGRRNQNGRRRHSSHASKPHWRKAVRSGRDLAHISHARPLCKGGTHSLPLCCRHHHCLILPFLEQFIRTAFL